MQSYSQDIKKEAREKLVKHAIRSLTIDRKDSFLVSKGNFVKITDHFNSILQDAVGDNLEFINEYKSGFFKEKNSWLEFYESLCTVKAASELRVLYLAGPEPYNDIEVLCKYGIRIENIWAIESDKKVYERALQSLIEANIHIKIHRGSLAEFFEFTNHEFDIVYFDACTPIFSSQQPPAEIIKQIFLNRRLTGLSALITNFAEPGDNYNWGEIMATWFATREEEEVPSEDSIFWNDGIEKLNSLHSYGSFINEHIQSYYDKFLTHFIPTLGAEIIPIWQLCSLGSVQSNHLLNEQKLKKTLNEIKSYKVDVNAVKTILFEIQHYQLAFVAYPLLNWARLISKNFSKEHVLKRFIDSTRRSMTIEDSLYIGNLLKAVEEANSGFKTFIHEICGDRLKEIISKINFFDRDMRLTCDIPMKNLFIELLIGLYGHPYIAHVGKTLGLKYKAKTTWMYSNVFIFDQSRYLYDFLPTPDLWMSFFENLANQTIVRGCMDGIRRNHFLLNNSLFKWGFIEGIFSEFGYSKLEERINLNSFHNKG